MTKEVQNEANGGDRHAMEGQSPVLDFRGKGPPRRQQRLSHMIIFVVFWSVFAIIVAAALWMLLARPLR